MITKNKEALKIAKLQKRKTFCNSIFLVISLVVLHSILLANFLLMPVGNYETQRFLLVHSLGIFVVASSAFLFWRHGQKFFRKVWPIMILVVGLLLSALVFNSAPFSAVEPGMYAAFFAGIYLLGFLSISIGRTYDWAVLFSYATVFVGTLYSGIAVMIYSFSLLNGADAQSIDLPWGFGNIRHWSHIATWLLPIFPIAALTGPLKNSASWQILTLFCATVWWWLVFLSAARGSMLGIAFGVILAVVLIGRPGVPWLKLFLSYLALGVVMWLVASVLVPSFIIDDQVVRGFKSNSSGRIPLFIEAWSMSLANFPFGMGPQSWLTHQILTQDYSESQKFGHPHNMYLMWAAEYGWLMIAGLILLSGQAIRLFWRRRLEIRSNSDKPEHALLLVAFTASVSAALIHAGASAVFLAPGSMLIGFFVIGLFWGLITPDTDLAAPTSSSKRFVFVGLIVLVMGVLCIYWLIEVWAYYASMRQDLYYYRENVSIETFPRFWSHGNYPRVPSDMP